MRQTIFFLSFIFLFISCTHENQFPPLKTEKATEEVLNLTGFESAQTAHIENSTPNSDFPICLQQLSASVVDYNQKNESFNFERFKEQWESCREALNISDLNKEPAALWTDATGLLLQLTAEEKYAQELEKILLNSPNAEVKNMAASYAITKNVDHLQVNLFIPAEVEYDHTLGGHVKMVSETNYPETGRIELHIDSEKKRYIELNIRIPSWASEAVVTVKGVKYFAPAGGYCKIAKQWREGDLVEVVFPGIRNRTAG